MENLNDPIGNRTGDLPTCNVMPQATAPLRTSWKVDIATNTKKCVMAQHRPIRKQAASGLQIDVKGRRV
jgi:hypothetical protein